MRDIWIGLLRAHCGPSCWTSFESPCGSLRHLGQVDTSLIEWHPGAHVLSAVALACSMQRTCLGPWIIVLPSVEDIHGVKTSTCQATWWCVHMHYGILKLCSLAGVIEEKGSRSHISFQGGECVISFSVEEINYNITLCLLLLWSHKQCQSSSGAYSQVP